MKRLFILLCTCLSAYSDPGFWGVTNAGSGLITGSSLTWSTSIVSASLRVYIRSTNTSQYLINSSLDINGSAAATPRFALGIFNRSSAFRLDALFRGSAFKSMSILTAPNLDLNKWYHIGVVFDASTSAGTAKIYLNGTNQSLTTDGTLNNAGITAGSSWDGQKFVLASNNTNTSVLNGVLTDVALWRGELTAAQFLALANGLQPSAIGQTPYVYWPLHPSGTEVLNDIVSSFSLSIGSYTNTNASPVIYRP